MLTNSSSGRATEQDVRLIKELGAYGIFSGYSYLITPIYSKHYTRCINFAKSWGFGGVCMANIFAYRATEPSAMKAATDPIGSENNDWLVGLSNEVGLVVAAWGNDGSYLGRSEQVKQLLPNLHCLKLNKSGEPAHPLYQKADMKPVPMNFIIKNSKNTYKVLKKLKYTL